MSPTKVRLLAVALLCVVAAACSDTPTADIPVLRVQLDRPSLTLSQGETAQFTVSSLGMLPPEATTSWQSSNPTVAKVDNQGRVTATGAGTADITAIVVFRGNSANAKGQVKVKGPPTRITLSGGSGQTGRVASQLPAPVTVRVADAAGNPNDSATVRFTARSPSGQEYFTTTATTDSLGDARVQWTLNTEAGRHTMVAELEGTAASTSAEGTASAGDPVQFILVSGNDQKGGAGEVLPQVLRVRVLDPFGNGVPATAVQWQVPAGSGSVRDAAPATDASGNATAEWQLGSVLGQQMLVSSSVAGSVSFQANASRAEAARVQISGAVAPLTSLGATRQLVASAYTASNALIPEPVVTWTALNPGVATVTAGGEVRAIAPGTGRVVALVDGRADTATVTVQQVMARIVVSPKSVALKGGASSQITGTALDAGGSPIPGALMSWTSTAPTVASVNQSGLVQALGGGTAQVIAYSQGLADTTVVTVASVATSISVSPGSASLQVGGQQQFTAVVMDAAGAVMASAPVTWTASPAGIVTVSNGLVTAVASGTATLKAASGSASESVSITVAATPPPPDNTLSTIQVTPATSGFNALGIHRQFAATARNASGQVVSGASITWHSTNPGVAKVSATGNVTSVANGTARIVASSGAAADTSTVVVNQEVASVEIRPGQVVLGLGDKADLVFKAFDANDMPITGLTPTWASSAPQVATVSQSGAVLAVSAGTSHITAQVGTHTASAQINITLAAQPKIASVSVSPRADTIRALGFNRKLAVVARDSAGTVVPDPSIDWNSLNPSIATVGKDGTVTGKAMGTALIVAIALSCPACTDTVAVVVQQDPAVIELSTTSLALKVGEKRDIKITIKDAGGSAIENEPATWTTDRPDVVSVSPTGTVTALGAGTATVYVRTSNGVTASALLNVADQPPPPPVAADGEFVVFPTPEIAFIIGPQLKSGSVANPWPWFDSNAIETGTRHGSDFPAAPVNNSEYINANYYDQALVQYTNYYRTGDVRYLEYARKIADSWWEGSMIRGGTVSPSSSHAPRNASLAGLMLRAMDGRPEMWDWITAYANWHLWNWGERRITRETLHYGVRDGGYALLFGTYVAVVHPSQSVREEYRRRVIPVARDYYARLQFQDGSWRWSDPAWPEFRMQPFMVGLLLEALIAVHKITEDPVLANAILRSTENLWAMAYRGPQVVDERPEFTWRGMWYTVYGADGPTGTSSLRSGGDTNSIREVRQLNATVVHAFGYAYRLSGDPKHLAWGDEVFAATFGNGTGPLSDRFYGLGDFRPKEYNQSYRSAGRYLAYRAGAR